MATPTTVPFTAQEKSVILSQLAIVMESAPFRSSKRYPAMLEYCVRHTLDGETEKLRERQLGITLFTREPGYETSSDPIVRMAASEIRRRLSQYYDLAGDQAQVRISLPPGSYVAEFRFLNHSIPVRKEEETVEATSNLPPQLTDLQPHATTTEVGSAAVASVLEENHRLLRFAQFVLSAVVVLVCVWGVWVLRSRQEPQIPLFWRTFLDTGDGQVLAVVGQLVHPAVNKDTSPDSPLVSDIFRTSHYVSIGDASSAMRACLVLAHARAECQMKAVSAINLSNVYARPVLLVGAYNNSWVLRVTQTLPYRFGDLACKCILDSKSGDRIGGVDFSIPREQITTDYSVVARFHSDVTDGPVVVIAGIGPMSTEAAAEFTTLPERSSELFAQAPKGWKGNNVEAVLATEVVNGIPGHTRILKTAFW